MDLYSTDAQASREQLEPFIVKILSAIYYNSCIVLEILIYSYLALGNHLTNKPTFCSSLYKMTDQGSLKNVNNFRELLWEWKTASRLKRYT